ncbi:MAG: tetratricopeptide (TPR) repeat protein [Verrucomicrobiales bacterium]|jgi:tetratricopeptide (TPR) repeat protein
MNRLTTNILTITVAASTVFLSVAQAQDAIRPTEITTETAVDPNAPPLEKLLEFANLLYQYGKFDEAAKKYTDFLQKHRTSPNAETAWYRLADCYRRLKEVKEAKTCYDTVIKQWPDGKYAGIAAYTMAVMTFSTDDYEGSLPYFQTATKKIADPARQIESQFFYGRALQLLDRKDDAIKEFGVLLAAAGASDFKERGEIEVAGLLLEKGDTDGALKHYHNLAENAKLPGNKEKARFKAGLLSLDKDPAKAEAFLQETLKSGASDEDKAQAQIALMMRAYDRKAYAEVTALYALAPIAAKGRARAQLELMVAHSQRLMENLPEAIALYGKIERDHRGTKEATEAGFTKLQCFHKIGDKELPLYVDRYVAAQSQVDPESQYIDLSLLLKAETLFEAAKFVEAAAAYRNVRPEKIDESYRSGRLYKMAWALADGGKADQGIEALGEFLAAYPEDSRVPNVLAKRATTFLEAENLDLAHADYLKLANDFPKSENAEFALGQVARIHRQKGLRREMVEAYQTLLQRFPKTDVQAEAYYAIGSGLYELKEYGPAIPPLKKARELDPEKAERITLRIIYAHLHQEQIQQLLAETKVYLEVEGARKLPIQIDAYLGRQLFDKEDFANAEIFLKRTGNPEEPKLTPPDIWEKLSKIHIDSGAWAEAVGDLDNFLVHQQHPEVESRALLNKARCLLRLKKAAEADIVALEVLGKVRQGRQNAEARIVLGEIAMAKGDLDEAAKYFVVVCELFDDPVMTPLAMTRMIEVLEQQGKTTEVDDYRKQLKTRFPNY